MPARKITRQDMRDAAAKYKNWGKWGPNDEIGTLNFTSPEDIIAAFRDRVNGFYLEAAEELLPARRAFAARNIGMRRDRLRGRYLHRGGT